jgi:nicotinate-nucleotide pyrophosphorylase (carboxylating)
MSGNQDLSADGRISRIVEQALMEDIGLGDITGDATVPEHTRSGAEFLCKQPGVIAGLEIAAMAFQLSDERVVFQRCVPDGSMVLEGGIVANVEGEAQSLLRAERVALNFLQRMSGIATLTREYVKAVEGTRAKITDTRKTVPGLRLIDKLAVRIGGGVNHRFGLDDMVLIKDNHIVAAGGITAAVERCREYLAKRSMTVAIEVETTSIIQVREALACDGITRIMLDNFPLPRMADAVSLIAGRVEVEASGGITLSTIRPVAETGVDFISVGALTHSVRALDISLEFTESHIHHA